MSRIHSHNILPRLLKIAQFTLAATNFALCILVVWWDIRASSPFCSLCMSVCIASKLASINYLPTCDVSPSARMEYEPVLLQFLPSEDVFWFAWVFVSYGKTVIHSVMLKWEVLRLRIPMTTKTPRRSGVGICFTKYDLHAPLWKVSLSSCSDSVRTGTVLFDTHLLSYQYIYTVNNETLKVVPSI